MLILFFPWIWTLIVMMKGGCPPRGIMTFIISSFIVFYSIAYFLF